MCARMKMSRWTSLPDDILMLVEEHGAAMIVQKKWRAYDFLKHTKRVEWERLRRYICCLDVSAFRVLTLYSHVRREWRQEPSSWFDMGRQVLHVIVSECLQGMWGTGIPLHVASECSKSL